MNIPTKYVDGYAAARKVDERWAEEYVRHTQIGDPLADAVVAELAEKRSPHEVHQTIAGAVDHYDALPPDTLPSLRELIEASRELPVWFDRELARDATRGFLRNSELVLGALVAGAIIEGFSTLISKSFRIRGRIMDNGVRRLKQNLLQLVNQYLPGGILPGGDGWKLSLRIRLVHAQSRLLIRQSGKWDESEYGMPLSAAHMLLGSVAFSGRLMQHCASLGGDMTRREIEGFVHVWRYTALVMGIPERIHFSDFESSLRAFRTATTCEPHPDDDAIIMAHSIINSAPIVLGFGEPKVRRKYAAFLYQVARELIGDETAERLEFPKGRLKLELPKLRLQKFGDRILRVAVPQWGASRAQKQFKSLLDVANLGDWEHSYRLPTNIYDEHSQDW